MSDFKYDVKEIKGKSHFFWGNKNAKIEIKNIDCQYFNEDTPVFSEKSIMYFYYNINYYIYNASKKWEKIWGVETFDFPSIIALQNVLKEVLNTKPDNTWEQYFYNEELIALTKTWRMSNILVDDYFSIMREYYIETKYSDYTLTLGGASTINGDSPFIGFVLRVDKNDLMELLKFAKNVIKYALEKENEIIRLRYEKMKKAFKINNGRLIYTNIYEDNKQYEPVELFVKGDIIEIHHKKNYKSVPKEICGEIKDIKGNYIIINELNSTTKYKVPINEIIYICYKYNDRILNYGLEECTKEFIKLLNNKEKKEFMNSSLKDLYKKYIYILIQRFVLCRDEHNKGFNDKKSTKTGYNIGKTRSKLVIKEIRKTLYKEGIK